MTNKRLIAALLAWSGLLTIALVAMLLFQTPQPVAAQTGVAAFSTIRVGSWLREMPRTAITITMNGWLTPTGSNQYITSAGAVATSGAKIAVKPAGYILTLTNVGAQTITFTETGTLVSAGNVALGPNDVATFKSDGTNWVQRSASNN